MEFLSIKKQMFVDLLTMKMKLVETREKCGYENG
jgi:hypothetical protein